MRVVFMGTPRFAAEILDELAEFHEIAAVYTRPDAVRGRGKALVPSPVKEVAERRGFPVRTPRTLRDAAVLSELAAFAPDAICVAAYGAILPKEVLDLPPFGCLNVHGSLLPRWRGAAPIERAILAGDEEIGVCIMAMEEGLDTGDYCVWPLAARRFAHSRRAHRGAGSPGRQRAAHGAGPGRGRQPALGGPGRGAGHLRREDRQRRAEPRSCRERRCERSPRACLGRRPSRPGRRRRPAADGAGGPRGRRCSRRPPGLRRGGPYREPTASRLRRGVLEVTEVKPDGKRAMDARSFAAGVPALRGEEGTWSRA